MAKSNTYLFITTATLLLPFLSIGQKTDTLPSVNIRTQKAINISSATNPVQQLNKETLSSLNSVSVADAAKYLPGVVVKDYGGIGGLKTISVRSLGANHTAVLLDGIAVGDAQGGQIDLGRFSLENIESVQLCANQPADVLMAARSFAGANVLSLSSSSFYSNEKLLQVKIETGSFGYVHPSITYKGKISKKINHTLFGEYQYANGVYAFKDYETGTGKSKRTNADIKAYHAEYDIAYHINDSNSIKFKTYYYHSKRGLPGAVILFNGAASQRLDNESWFTQFAWRNIISAKSSLLLSGKYAYDYKFYLDPTYLNNAGKLENIFRQKEIYFSAAYSYKIVTNVSAAIASDFFYSQLNRTDTFDVGFAFPSRNNWLNNISLQYKTNRVEVAANLLHTYVTQKVKAGPVANDHSEFTPAVAFSAQILRKLPVRIRASYKKIFRVPTFDDLYYTNIGNSNLKPEYVDQFNAGITAVLLPSRIAEEIIITTDAFYSKVKDKILASPRFNLFQWSMMNIGEADIRGLDAAINIKWKRFNKIDFSSRMAYTYQRAIDVTNASSVLYKKQLPYTPEHTGSLHLAFVKNNLSLSFNTLASSHRYGVGQQQQDNFVKGFITEDIAAAFTFYNKATTSLRLTTDFNNIFNNQYEIIKFYPMPGFNWRVGLSANF